MGKKSLWCPATNRFQATFSNFRYLPKNGHYLAIYHNPEVNEGSFESWILSPSDFGEKRGSEVLSKTPGAELARWYEKTHIHSETMMADFRLLFQKQLEGMGEEIQGHLFDKHELDHMWKQELFTELKYPHPSPSNEISKFGCLNVFFPLRMENPGKLDFRESLPVTLSLALWDR